MPITFSVNNEHGYVHSVWTDDVDAVVYASYLRALLTDPEAMRLKRTLTDLRLCRPLLTGSDMGNAIRAEAAPRLGDSVWQSCILVGTDVQFGLARQFEGWAGGLARCAIFKDEAAALAWLQQNP